MIGLSRMQKERRRPCTGQCSGNLFPDDPRLAHTGYDHLSRTLQYGLYRLGKIIRQQVAQITNRRSFRFERIDRILLYLILVVLHDVIFSD